MQLAVVISEQIPIDVDPLFCAVLLETKIGLQALICSVFESGGRIFLIVVEHFGDVIDDVVANQIVMRTGFAGMIAKLSAIACFVSLRIGLFE